MAASEKSTETLVKPEGKYSAQIKSADMNEEMQQEAVEVAQQAMEQFSIEKVSRKDGVPCCRYVLDVYFEDIAQYIKKEFDSRRGATWHCIVGRNFGSFVTHETKHFIYFYLGHCAILLFKTQNFAPRGLMNNGLPNPWFKNRSQERKSGGLNDTT